MTPEQLAKLPRWAQDYIRNLRMSLEAAVRHARQVEDSETPSPISYTQLVSDNPTGGPSARRHYVQATRIGVEFGGVLVSVACGRSSGGEGLPCVEVAATPADGRFTDVAFVPMGFNSLFIRAIPKKA